MHLLEDVRVNDRLDYNIIKFNVVLSVSWQSNVQLYVLLYNSYRFFNAFICVVRCLIFALNLYYVS